MTNLIALTENRNPGDRKRAITACAFVVIAIFLYAIRRIDQVVNPQLWAEDGVIFLQEQMSLGFGAVFHPYVGYLHLLPRLIALLVDSVAPIVYIPAAYVAGSLIAVALSSIVIAFARLPWPAGPLFALAAVMMPHGGEVFLNITNVQWIVAPLLMLIAIQDAPRNYLDVATDLLVVVIVGLTGPFIIFAAPFIAGRLVWRGRSLHNFALAGASILIAIIQALSLSSAYQPPFENGLSIGIMLSILGDFWSGLLLSFITQTPLGLKWVLMTLTFISAIVLWRFLPGRTKTISIMFFIISLAIFASAARKWGSIPDSILPFGAGQRYFYIPFVLTAWVFILGILEARRPANWIAVALLLMIIASTTRAFQAPPLPDMEWRRHVANLGAEPLQIPINPPGWFVTVRQR